MADIDLKPTEDMASNAARGLELREKHGRGGTAIGVARARDIKNRANLSPETVRRMHAFFNRHEKNKAGGEDDAGYIAWMLWGGDSGRSWAASKVKQLDRKEENGMSDTYKEIAARLGTEGKSKFAEAGDRYGDALMKPVTLANAKAMERLAAEAIKHAKKVGDDDLLELAEEVGREVQALRSRASRPGAKATFVNNRSNLEAVGKQLRDLDKAIDTSRSLLREDAKQARWGDCINRCEYISQKYQDLKGAYRNYAREAGAWANPTTASRPGTKAEFASVPTAFTVEERSLLLDIKEIKEAYKRADPGILMSYARQMLETAKTMHSDCMEDARDMRAHPEDWSRPGKKFVSQAPSTAELERLFAKFQESQKLFTPNKYHDSGERKRMQSGAKQDIRFFNELIKAVRANDGPKAKEILAKADSLLKAYFVPSEIKKWASQHMRPGAKAKFGYEGTVGRLLDEAGVDESTYEFRNGTLYVDSNAPVNAIKEALRRAYIAGEIKRMPSIARADFSRPGAKAKMAKVDRARVMRELRALRDNARAERNREAERLASMYLAELNRANTTEDDWEDADMATSKILEVLHGEYARPGSKKVLERKAKA